MWGNIPQEDNVKSLKFYYNETDDVSDAMRNIKYLLFFAFLLDLASQVPVEAKPVPPGSGEGDVAANILFLIDSLYFQFLV